MKNKSLMTLALVLVLLASLTSFVVLVEGDPNYNPVLFVHGWTESASDWDWMINEFVSDGWPSEMLYAFTFSDPGDYSDGANVRNAGEIVEWVDQILNETGAEKVDLVSHSMGGLSTRHYVKFLGGIDIVDDYVSLASPHHGTTMAIMGGDMAPDSAFLENLNEGDETPGGILPDTEGWRDDPVGEGGYNGAHVPGNITWTSIRSNTDSLVKPPETVILDGAVNMERSIGHMDFLTDEQVYEWVKAAIYEPTMDITVSPDQVFHGSEINITTTIYNGPVNYNSTGNLTIYANETIIETITNITIEPQQTKIINYTWDTTDWPWGTYKIKAMWKGKFVIDNETYTFHDTYIDCTVHITIPGDVDGDFDVDADDYYIFAGAYGTSPPSNPACDLDSDGDVDSDDYYIFAGNYGKS